jgi:hypothetical protein
METFTTLVDHAISLKKDFLRYIKTLVNLIPGSGDQKNQKTD